MRTLSLLLSVTLITSAFAANPLNMNLDGYFALGVRSTRLKNLTITAPGCNLGTSCPAIPGSSRCGTLKAKGASVAAPGQVAAAVMCGPGSYFEVFRNNSSCDPSCPQIANPGSSGDCTEPLVGLPIIGDLDGDTVPSCGGPCVVDSGDTAAACGQTLPLPACDPLRIINVAFGADCGTDDVLLGNGQCDLGPGSYGKIKVAAGATLAFHAGTSRACGLLMGAASRVLNVGTVTLLVPGKGQVRLNNNGQHGGGCGTFSIVSESGKIHLGKRNDVDLDACSIGKQVRLGNTNALRGRYIGFEVVADGYNVGHCCGDFGTSTAGAFTETAYFYETQPGIVSTILGSAGGSISACGRTLTNQNIDVGNSLTEALCNDTPSDPRVMLARELTAAALSTAAGGATFSNQTLCDARCASGTTPLADVLECVGWARRFNVSGAHLPFPLAVPPPNTLSCSGARVNACNIVFTGGCAVP